MIKLLQDPRESVGVPASVDTKGTFEDVTYVKTGQLHTAWEVESEIEESHEDFANAGEGNFSPNATK